MSTPSEEPRDDIDPALLARVLRLIQEILARLLLAYPMAFALWAALLAIRDGDPAGGWANLLGAMGVLTAGARRPWLGTLVVLCSACLEWLAWRHAPSLPFLPPVMGTYFFATLALVLIEFVKPSVLRPEVLKDPGGEAERQFGPMLVFATPVFAAWLFAMGRGLH
jgi:hypothetical protein